MNRKHPLFISDQTARKLEQALFAMKLEIQSKRRMIILITGATGTGKSFSLNMMLNFLGMTKYIQKSENSLKKNTTIKILDTDDYKDMMHALNNNRLIIVDSRNISSIPSNISKSSEDEPIIVIIQFSGVPVARCLKVLRELSKFYSNFEE
ncbi:hypothetical protein M153_19878000193, partial [Pseudoloma neurophilia]